MPRKIELKVLGEDPARIKELYDNGQIGVEDVSARMQNVLIDYRKIMIEIVTSPLNKREGMQAKEMMDSVDLGGVIKKAGDVVILQDAEYDLLIRKLDAFAWGLRAHENIKSFIVDVRKAETIDLNG